MPDISLLPPLRNGHHIVTHRPPPIRFLHVLRGPLQHLGSFLVRYKSLRKTKGRGAAHLHLHKHQPPILPNNEVNFRSLETVIPGHHLIAFLLQKSSGQGLPIFSFLATISHALNLTRAQRTPNKSRHPAPPKAGQRQHKGIAKAGFEHFRTPPSTRSFFLILGPIGYLWRLNYENEEID